MEGGGDYTDPRVQNMDGKKKQQRSPSNGSASGQEKDAECANTIKRRLASNKKAIIGIVISHLIFGLVLFFLGTLVPLNCQKDAIKCPAGWIGHKGRCYNLSGEVKNWKESQNFCTSHNASLAKITEKEMNAIKCPFVTCPFDWIGHKGRCYNFSGEEKNWKESQKSCMSHNASLAKITKEEMNFVTNLTRNHVFWIGLKREPEQPWKWLDGENSTLEVMGNGGDCAYLADDATANSGTCSIEHRYICKKNDFMRA